MKAKLGRVLAAFLGQVAAYSAKYPRMCTQVGRLSTKQASKWSCLGTLPRYRSRKPRCELNFCVADSMLVLYSASKVDADMRMYLDAMCSVDGLLEPVGS